jgi:hypothetical protein
VQILHDDLGLKKFHLRWIPRALDLTLENERLLYSRQVFEALEQAKHDDFRRIMTEGESRFFLFYPRDSAWAKSRCELPSSTKQEFDIEKCLVSVLWSVNMIHSLLDVPRCMIFNTPFFCEQVLARLADEMISDSRRKTLKGILIHLDNACPHNSELSHDCFEATKTHRLPYPPYSPDIAPNDFLLFR